MEAQRTNNLISALFEKFITQMRAEGKSKATLRNLRFVFGLFNDWKNDIALDDLTPENISVFMVYLDEREKLVGRNKVIRPLTNSSRATVMNKLGLFFNWLVKHGHIKENPYDYIKYPQVSYTDQRAFTEKEFDKIFLAVVRDIKWESKLVAARNTAIVMLLRYTGIRKGELIGLLLKDLVLEERRLTIRAEISKSKRARTLIVHEDLVPYLENYLYERRKYQTPHLWVSNNSDRNFTEHGLKHLKNKLTAATKINCHWHRFRHTFAVGLYRQTHNIISLQKVMGHQSLKQTLAYLRSIPDEEHIQQMSKMTIKEFV